MKDDLHDLYKRWLAEADARLEAEREARLADTIAIHDLRAEVERERSYRLDADRAMSKMAVEVAALRGIIAERDATMDVAGCDDCGSDCDDCGTFTAGPVVTLPLSLPPEWDGGTEKDTEGTDAP